MKIGILWTDGEVTPQANITDAMRGFINGRRNQAAFAGFGPVRLMGQKQGQWVPLEPDAQQIKKCLQIASYMAQLFEAQKLREPLDW